MTSSAGSTSRASRIVTAVLVAALVAIALVYRAVLGAWFSGKELNARESTRHTSATTGHASPEMQRSSAVGEDIDHYTCSMHPSVDQPGPGKCPICGMDLIPVTKLQQTEGVVMIDEGRRQLIGVRTAPVIEGPMSRTFRAVGRVAYDESAFTDVNLKVSGWITKLFVNQTGQRVVRGQTLFTLYSPELYHAQQDFLLAARSARSAAPPAVGTPSRVDLLAPAARKRLSLLGLRDAQIDDIASRDTPLDTIPITSPASGFVIEKDVVEGASVAASTRLFRIAALDKVWIEAEVYEADLAHVRAGQRAKVTLDYLPGQAYEAKVAYVYPYLPSAARTGRVRIELANEQRELRPGMYASVELAADIGSRVQVPASAVVYTGPRRLVFVDLGEGRFKPQEVRVGAEANGMYEVLEGLEPGDSVASSGTFLIAAEARISTAAKYWDPDAPPSLPPTSLTPSGLQSPTTATPSGTYNCPMHPEVRTDAPGKCPECGMDLVPVPNRKTR